MNRDIAADLLAKMLYEVGVEGGYKAFFDTLKNPSGPYKHTWEEFRRWYDTQPDETQKLVQFMAKEAMVLAVFGIAVDLDGGGSYHFIGDQPAELAVALRVFKNLESIKANTHNLPQETVEICPTTTGEDIHDIFLYYVDQSYTED